MFRQSDMLNAVLDGPAVWPWLEPTLFFRNVLDAGYKCISRITQTVHKKISMGRIHAAYSNQAGGDLKCKLRQSGYTQQPTSAGISSWVSRGWSLNNSGSQL